MYKRFTRIIAALLTLASLALPACAQETPALELPALAPIACEASPSGSTLDLYCGPTQGFYRHSDQALDLGKPYVYFGQFDCWSMVAQGTQEAFGPVGWVETALLDTLPDAPELGFDDAFAAMVEDTAPVTNDPHSAPGDGAWPISLARGEEVIVLAQLGDWLYVQTSIADTPARVFIPAASVL